ncbi:hypothetical protein JQS43_11500 [Natronosporangium hydrolyticum]|uniref:Uncharacterized protein n=1 Tax=Natronosporangium hydrolyticum TaxID=2811111 RepID=A0A895YS53_9ACTN|nr:hypothetical protein [Natronosporangium hydrolyticum]QSB16848.1 hypothetical protein JQS43_11500 [Natronosporangium hydrolyticum]
MGGLQSGGGTSAVAASEHAGCERFRLTDPFLTGQSRKALAAQIGHPDTSAGIPVARWVRAMTFEALVGSEQFAAELLTRTIGRLGLPRPEAIRRRDCIGAIQATAEELAQAHRQATSAHEATLLTAPAVPYLDLADVADATPVQPDFAIVAPRPDSDGHPAGSWLIMGDAKDYERVRARIDDGRMLKGFLQVALGAEAAAGWRELPAGMRVHRFGTLAVPRNAFLQPEAVVERLDDHRVEVRARADERLAARSALGGRPPAEDELATYVAGLAASFDPGGCVSCHLFSCCRAELRADDDPVALLTELGVDRLTRPLVAGLVTGDRPVATAVPYRVRAQVTATVTGVPQWTGRRRVDPCGLPGTINVVLVKSDAAVLGVHGVALQAVGIDGPGEWVRRSFPEPQSQLTRRSLLGLIGDAIRRHHEAGIEPVHVVVPDRPTADLLATAADSLAGVELSRLRWQQDLASGRPALTFDGEPAELPEPLTTAERTAVSFFLEEDRARAMSLRTPVVELRSVLAAQVVPGGPTQDAGRLDYLVTWAEATGPLAHRSVSDDIAEQVETPGARLSNTASDAIYQALRDPEARSTYEALVRDALAYRIEIVDRALAVLGRQHSSRLRWAHRELERDAQQIWRRRLELQASDLVRFSRTHPGWRNSHVEILDADRTCSTQLSCLVDPTVARDLANDAGVREVALATVVERAPLRLRVHSRRLVAGSRVVALHVNGESLVEADTTTVKLQRGSFKLGGLPIAPLAELPETEGLGWQPAVPPIPSLQVGDELVLADTGWFGRALKSGHEITVARPPLDSRSAPKETCTAQSYADDPETHQWCCRPHPVAEAEWSDLLAQRRADGELNPEVWPPLVDLERFDVGPGAQVAEPAPAAAPDQLTLDDLD